ncbi:hypothetical protein ACG2LH_05125 [Zhouia sp. PK063]|uniref:hypothetical protein n=1 Tax=Zhouia sp. PK063 TaxID=3373602 RepID=UPI0037B3E434
MKIELKNNMLQPEVKNTQALLTQATAENLYVNLVNQLQKDVQLANLEWMLPEDVTPSQLIIYLHEFIYQLISHRFTAYLNLLYIIDVSEDKIKALDGSDLVALAKNVSFLILKREWQKVWLKNTYQ